MSEADDVIAELRKTAAPEEPYPWDHPVIQAEQALIDAAAPRNAGKAGYAGLAFSGGGIRSATFGLGVLQALKERGVLEKFDYLSSVSGGGYISAWLSSNCQRHGRSWLGRDAKWEDSIRHLRRFSNYLSPQVGFFSADTWTMLMIWLRNALLIQVSVLLGLAVVLLLPRVFALGFPVVPFAPWARGLAVLTFMSAIVSVAANLVSLHPGMHPGKGGAGQSRTSFAASGWRAWLCLCILFSILAGGSIWYSKFWPFSNGPVSPMAFPIALFMVMAAFCAVPPLLALKGWLIPRLRGIQFLGRIEDEDSVINYGQRQVQVTVILPTIVTAFMLSAVMWGVLDPATSAHPMYASGTYREVLAEGWLYWPFPLAVAFAAFILLAFCSMRGLKERNEKDFKRFAKRSLLAFFSALLCILSLHAQLGGIVLLMQALKESGASGPWHAFALGPPLLLVAFSLSITLLIGLIGQASVEGIREWWSRVAAWLCIYAFGWVLVTMTAIYGPLALAWLVDKDNWATISAAGAWVVATLGGLFAGKSGRSTGDNKIRSSEPSATEKAINFLAVVGPYLFVAGLLIGLATAIHLLLWSLNANEPDSAWRTAKLLRYSHWSLMSVEPGVVLGVFAACVAAWSVMSYRVDINVFSLNAFYRNRLVRCYLGASRLDERDPQNFTNFDDHDDMPMSRLGEGWHPPLKCWHPPLAMPVPAPRGPLHIVNCALNLGGSSDLDLHTRHSASFTITPYTIGSSYLARHAKGGALPGYQLHRHYGRAGNHTSLGQAISVSGAAASPNMGYHTSPATALLLTLFNVRLGWWFRSPVRANALEISPRLGQFYLLSELFAVAHDKLKYLMISDGGHFENLAVYELIRRKCLLVVVSDAECDRDMKFEGLGTLIRMCKLDFNVDIDINVDTLKLSGEAGTSHARYAFGTIRYNDGDAQLKKPDSVGMLIYIKASMDGVSEDTSIVQYKSTHADFPHESTGDQFYGEDQFESYRRLGRQIATSAFAEGLSSAKLSKLQRLALQSAMPESFGGGENSLYRPYRPSRGPVASWPVEHSRRRRNRLVLSMAD